MIKIFNKSKVGSVVAQPLGVLAALVEDLGLVPSTRMAAHNHLELQFQEILDALFWPPWAPHTHIQEKHPHT